MVANPKQELHALIEHLSDDAAAETLAFARQLRDETRSAAVRAPTATPRRPQSLPTLHHAPAISSIDDLRTDLFPPEEDVEEFDAAIRRWREEPEGV